MPPNFTSRDEFMIGDYEFSGLEVTELYLDSNGIQVDKEDEDGEPIALSHGIHFVLRCYFANKMVESPFAVGPLDGTRLFEKRAPGRAEALLEEAAHGTTLWSRDEAKNYAGKGYLFSEAPWITEYQMIIDATADYIDIFGWSAIDNFEKVVSSSDAAQASFSDAIDEALADA